MNTSCDKLKLGLLRETGGGGGVLFLVITISYPFYRKHT